MAGNIKGITIEFRGDTTKLDKAIRQVDSNTAKLDKSLRQVDKALKFNPTNVDLWRQKQQLLTQKVEQTKEKLSALKDAQKQMDASGVDKSSQEYQKLQREIIETESKLKTFNGQLREVGNVNLRAASAQVQELGSGLTSAGQAMAGLSAAGAAVVASLGAAAAKSASWADDLNTMSKVYSISTDELQKYALAADLVDVSVETIAGSHAKLIRSMNSVTDETSGTGEAFSKLGVDIYNSSGEFRNADDIWNDVISALGNVQNETERDALAMQLLGKSAQELNPLIEDGGETFAQLGETLAQYDLDFISQEQLDKANEFNDKIDTMKAIGTLAFQQVGVALAEQLAPALEKVVDLVGKFASWLGNLDPKVLVTIGVIAGIIAVIAPLLLGLGQLAFAISSIMGLMATLSPILAGISAPILPIIAAVAALVAVGVLLYKNWDTIKEKAVEIWGAIKQTFGDAIENIRGKVQSGFQIIQEKIISPIVNAKNRAVQTIQDLRQRIGEKVEAIRTKVGSVFESVKKKITDPIEKAKETVSGAVEKIKGFFPFSLGKILNLKIPHISVSGGQAPFGIGGRGSLPSFSVDWYKTGGIFDSPSIIGVGEAGSEAVVPLDKFWNKIDGLSGNTININVSVNGAEDPTEWANKLVRQMKLELRSI